MRAPETPASYPGECARGAISAESSNDCSLQDFCMSLAAGQVISGHGENALILLCHKMLARFDTGLSVMKLLTRGGG
jgi:hypothetical protein